MPTITSRQVLSIQIFINGCGVLNFLLYWKLVEGKGLAFTECGGLS